MILKSNYDVSQHCLAGRSRESKAPREPYCNAQVAPVDSKPPSRNSDSVSRSHSLSRAAYSASNSCSKRNCNCAAFLLASGASTREEGAHDVQESRSHRPRRRRCNDHSRHQRIRIRMPRNEPQRLGSGLAHALLRLRPAPCTGRVRRTHTDLPDLPHRLVPLICDEGAPSSPTQ